MERRPKGKTFKLGGHTLPGINQRMDQSSRADGKPKSSAFQQNEMGVDMEEEEAIDESMALYKSSEQKRTPAKYSKEYQESKEKVKAALSDEEPKPDHSHISRGDEDESGGPKKNPFKK